MCDKVMHFGFVLDLIVIALKAPTFAYHVRLFIDMAR